jgi:murein DD-endopeptidase MepM/ murein hydrolase activator NlpD
MNSPFGVRRLHNSEPTGNYHRGLDQRSKRGTPVRAITGGVVRIVRMFNLHGGTVGIDHGEGVTSFYLHLSRFHVKEGARVRGGDVVGYAGSTGFATGPHLHWQLTVNGVPVNPHQWVEGIAPCPEKAAPRKTTRPKKRVRQ